MTAVENRNGQPWIKKRYWPVGFEPPRLEDGSVDVRALCRLWDEVFNEGLPSASQRKESA